jgi:hypothetical protein
MINTSQTAIQPTSLTRAAGTIAIVSGVVAAVGVVFLIGMFILFTTPFRALALRFGIINDICIMIQYLLAIPVALALYRILRPYHPTLITLATFIGITAMLVVIALQLALIRGVLAFEEQVVWVSLAMIGGVGAWLVITGLVARSTGRLPNSVLVSLAAVPYLGYPLWAFWIGRRLLSW